MLDFLYLSKEEFLASYSYLTEEEYNATVDAVLLLLYPNDPQPEAEPAPPLRVCLHCLQAIESREGQQITRKIYIDEDENPRCDWCEDTANEGGFDALYEIL